MKNIAIFVAALKSLFWTMQGCAEYRSCHCYDANGKPNDVATAIICAGNLESRTDLEIVFREWYY
ncbi:hypothetical protein CORC01_10336 [Colletotrichum orchidophilum]|uniref:Uncharacterized protein n=1 Tax=Colletotrichum orchidophilum TaxID=1209926 RepID=A0A1G4AZ02_9PEZI|nr:uncharacterized protein CORC01_10336 [Colletotrichum orchidophilum]OHE94408.1 hypothetical protein CORC01_10336 [Colletotrichum orchidophilum]